MLKKDNKQNHYLILLFIQIIFLVCVQSSAFAVEPQILLDSQYYMTGSTVHITITDATANTDASGREIINVNVKSSTDTSGISVDLLETGVSTSVFEGSLLLAPEASEDGYDKLQVDDGDTITLTYNGRYTADAAVDDTPPVLSSHDPASDAMGVGPAITTISVAFNEPVQWGINSGGISIVEHDYYLNHVNILSKAISGDNNSTLLLTISSLAWNKTYTVTVPAGAIQDRAGNPNSAVTWNFTTVSMKLDKTVYRPRDTVTVTIYDSAKKSGSATVKAECSNYTSGPIYVNLSGSGGVFTGSFTLSGPAGDSDDNNDILGVTAFHDGLTVSYDLDDDGIFDVLTGADVDGESPTVNTSSPSANETNVTADRPVTITFNEDIQQGDQFNLIGIGYNDGTGWKSAGGIDPIINGKTLTINHANLKYNTEYDVIIYTNSVQDLAGNPYDTGNSILLTFTTQAVPNREIHVAIDGSDIIGDGTQSTPYKTIAKAVQTANDGDSIIVHDGTYEESIVLTKDVTITSVNGPGATTVQTGSSYVFEIMPAHGSYGTRRITGLKISGATRGIYISGMAGGLVYVENNVISGCSDSGIYIDNHSDGTVYIRKNTISSNTGTGINLETSADGRLVKVKWNNILLNSYKGIVHDGTNQLDASLNYWGGPHGPSHDSINYGNAVSGNINFQPWLVNEFTGTEVSTELTVTKPTLSDAYSGLEYFNELPLRSNTTGVHWSLYSGSMPVGMDIVEGKALYGHPRTVGSYYFALEAGDGTQAVYKDVSLDVVTNYSGNGPAVISRSPVPYEPSAPVNAQIKIIFNEPVQLAANNAGYINIINTADLYDIPTVDRSVGTTNTADDTLIIDHLNFRPNTLYKVSLSNNVVMDMDGNGFNTEWYFTTSSQVPALGITTTSLQDGTDGNPYSLTLKASGGVGDYTWSLASGSTLPEGLSMNTTGLISGIPTTTGTYTFTVQVADQAAATATQQLAIIIHPAADTTPPAVVLKTPQNGASGVLINALVTVKFDETIQAGDNFADISIFPQGGTAVTEAAVINGDTLTINHTDFAGNTGYTVTIPANAVKDMAGNVLSTEISWYFTSGEASDVTAPLVTITQPAESGLFNGPVSVAGTVHEDNLKEVEVTIKSVTANKYWDGTSGAWVSNETWNTGNFSGVAPNHSFQYQTPGKSQNAPEGAYTAGVRAKDYSGNVSSTVSVNYSLDLTQPEISFSSPLPGAHGVPVDAPTTMTFNKDVTAGDLSLITFKNASTNTDVSFQAAFDEKTNTLTITHEDLNYDKDYEVFVEEGVVKDLAGNKNVEKQIPFHTAEYVSASPEISSSSPLPDAHGVPVDAPITMTFNKDVTAGDLTKIIFQNGDDVAVPFQAAFDEKTNTLTITHGDLNYETYYEIIVNAGVVKDLDGNNNVYKLIGFYTTEESIGGGTTPEITVIFEDEDGDGIYYYYPDGTGDTLTFSLSGLPEGLTLRAQFGALDENGNFTVTGAVYNGWVAGEESAAYPGVYLFSVDIATPNDNSNLPLAIELGGLPEGVIIPPFILKDTTTDPVNPRTARVNITAPGTVSAGDIDGSKIKDMADAIVALQVIADINMNSTEIYPEADVNGDDKIGLEEVVYILQAVAELRGK